MLLFTSQVIFVILPLQAINKQLIAKIFACLKLSIHVLLNNDSAYCQKLKDMPVLLVILFIFSLIFPASRYK